MRRLLKKVPLLPGIRYRFLSNENSKLIQIDTAPHAVKPITQFYVMHPINKPDDHGNRTLIAFWLTVFSLGYFFLDAAQREREIIRKRIHNEQEESHFIIPINRLTTIGKKPRGDLSGAIVRDDKTGIEYLEKGAKDFEALVIEIVFSNLLALLRPGVQPEAKIAQEIKDENNSRFYSLSRKVGNAVDIEEFIRTNPNWEEKLQSKPIVGLDESLAADYMLAKQRDMKLANYLIADQGDYYEIISIDHEFAMTGGSSSQFYCGDDDFLKTIVNSVNDLHQPGEFNHAGLAGDSRAQRFFEIAAPQMSPEKIVELYEKFTALDRKKINDLTMRLKNEGFLTETEAQYYQALLLDIQNKAQVALSQIAEENHLPNSMKLK